MHFIDLSESISIASENGIGFGLESDHESIQKRADLLKLKEVWTLHRLPPSPILRQWKKEKDSWVAASCYLLTVYEIQRTLTRIAVTVLYLMKTHYSLTTDEVTVSSSSAEVRMGASLLGMAFVS